MKYIDLSHPISNEMATYPSDPDISIVREKEIYTDRTLLHSFTMGTHTGTHLDAPAHIISGGKTLDDFPISSFTGNTVNVDINLISALDKMDEKIDGIIFDSGWYRKFKEPKIYFGSDRPEIPKSLVEIAVKMGIKYFGCDLPSVDMSGSKEKPIHNALLGNDIIIYESLTNLHRLPRLTPFQFFGFPLSFKELDGSPVRAVAILN
ncbi:MAG: cyclase family protein [Candidatus Marinimicrobia bacterium]|jgi:arylformamidase|nr:cyclase family protein [Candidatus Neomarinimicrobiota bacterium]